MVVTKGIGPGPPDTKHHGCCSQLALFVAKDYQKQPDLTLNSLALVASALILSFILIDCILSLIIIYSIIII